MITYVDSFAINIRAQVIKTTDLAEDLDIVHVNRYAFGFSHWFSHPPTPTPESLVLCLDPFLLLHVSASPTFSILLGCLQLITSQRIHLLLDTHSAVRFDRLVDFKGTLESQFPVYITVRTLPGNITFGRAGGRGQRIRIITHLGSLLPPECQTLYRLGASRSFRSCRLRRALQIRILQATYLGGSVLHNLLLSPST